MKQRYNEITDNLCMQAVRDCFRGKWYRNDVSCVIEEYAGIRRRDIAKESTQGNSTQLKNEAIKNIGYEIQNRLTRLQNGDANALDLDPVQFRFEKDGMNGKVRKIAYCCVFHQIFNHLATLALMPLFRAKILPTQYASIPHKGQTGLKNYVIKALRRKKFNIRYAKKTDVVHAYESTMYSVVIDIIEKEIPSAKLLLLLLKALAKMSPEGCLIIGGYLDAWLFNFLMSYALRYALSQSKTKRGKKTRLIKVVVSFMDDFGFTGSRAQDIENTIKLVNDYLLQNFGLRLKRGKETAFLSFAEEKQRRKQTHPSARGCPIFDIGGYQMHRSYITIRKAIFLRARRAFLRAMVQLRKFGRLCLQIAQRINAYFGYFKNSNSKKARQKYCIDKLHEIAKQTISYYQKLKNKKRRFSYV